MRLPQEPDRMSDSASPHARSRLAREIQAEGGLPLHSYRPLSAAVYRCVEHAPYLKGLLKPFKGKGDYEVLARQCEVTERGLKSLARCVVTAASVPPFNLLPVHLTLQTTGAGTTFLRWRNVDRTRMGVALWEELIASPATPIALVPDLYALELDRIALNMQMSVLHTLARQAIACASHAARADTAYIERLLYQTIPQRG